MSVATTETTTSTKPAEGATPPAETKPAEATPPAETKPAAPAIPEGYVKVPGKDAPADEVAAFAKALGVPDRPDAYAFDAPKDKGWDDAFAAKFRETALTARLTPAQAAAVAGLLTGEMGAHVEAMATVGREAAAALATEWGAEAAPKTELARRALLAHAPVDAVTGLLAELPLLGKDRYPILMRALAAAGAAAAERPAPRGDTGPGDGKKPLHERLYQSGASAA